MGSADFKLVKPVAITSDVPFTRASPKWVFDRSGTLVQVPTNALAVAYDPADLGSAPYALVEAAATNSIRNNTMQGAVVGIIGNGGALPVGWNWPAWPGCVMEVRAVYVENGIDWLRLKVSGVSIGGGDSRIFFHANSEIPAASIGQTWAASVFLRSLQSTKDRLDLMVQAGPPGNIDRTSGLSENYLSATAKRVQALVTCVDPATYGVRACVRYGSSGASGQTWNEEFEIGLPQLERDRVTSPIKTVPTFVRRPTVGTYCGSAGALQTAAIDVERISYDPGNLSVAPYRLWETGATNYIRNNTMQGASAGTPGALPNYWQWGTNVGLSYEVARVGVENGVECVDVRIFGTATGAGFAGIYFEGSTSIAAAVGQVWANSVYCRGHSGTLANISSVALCIDENNTVPSYVTGASAALTMTGPEFPQSRGAYTHTVAGASTAYILPHIKLFTRGAGVVDFTLRIGLPQTERDRLTSPIKTTNATVGRAADEISNPAVTRAADVVGAGAGLVYSNVPITEPAYSSTTTYAKDAIVLDPSTRLTYQSLIDANKGQALTTTTAWLPLGATNRWKMFDKAVNSQTSAAEVLTVVIKPGELVNTLPILNVVGASVAVAQSDSGYSRTRSLVTHDVLSWYDYWYQEPLWLGDTVFDDVPPYPNSLLTITVSSPGNQAAIGGVFAGKAKFIGVTQWELTAGILSYSTPSTDKFGNTTLFKRENAKRMNFEVAIPRGYEDEVYRFMRAADNVEMVAIATTNWALAMSYGYLGAWELPLSIEGKKMPVEWRGLI